MNTVFNFSILLPASLLLIQAFLLVFLGWALLRRSGMLRSKPAELEGPEGLMGAGVLFGLLLIGLADVEGSYQAYRTYANVGRDVSANTLARFSQFFLVVFLCAVLYTLVCWLIYRLLPGLRTSMTANADAAWGPVVLYSLLVVGFALTLAFCAHEVVEQLTPQYLNFR